MYDYKATVVRWIDADTVELVVDLGFNDFTKEHFRLIGIDAPERNTREGVQAKERVNELAPPGATVYINSRKAEPIYAWEALQLGRTFTRWLAIVYLIKAGVTQKSVAQILIEEGLGVPR